jgi:hypothetical protein
VAIFFYACFFISLNLKALKSTKLKPRYSKRLKIIIIEEHEIKVSSVPNIGKNSFSSITPKIEVGIVKSAE